MIGLVLGGVGLFLLGMALLTDGLRAVAGDRLRHALQRFTRTRLSSVATGAAVTAAVQSSSATTLLTIGFVGAGLLSLRAALGVVFGANVGTTVTSWIVAAIGLKVKMGTFALPLIGVGALGRLFTRGRKAAFSSALAGFGLVFMGIDVLQDGMRSLSTHIDLATFAGRGPGALVVLVIVGLVMTVVMQSSSAAVATTLAAVSTGTIDLMQAGALVIGQNMGTTVTAAIGAVGGSATVRRTALAHFVFNLVTGLVALGLLPVLWSVAADKAIAQDPALAISAFHTAFNALGVAMFVPFTDKLAAWLERRVPERGAALTRRLAVGRSARPTALLQAAWATLHEITGEAATLALDVLGDEVEGAESVQRAEAIERALGTTRAALGGLSVAQEGGEDHRRHVALLHALDHLHRLEEALGEPGHTAVCARHEATRTMTTVLLEHLADVRAWAHDRGGASPDVTAVSRRLANLRRDGRPTILERTAGGDLEPDEGVRLLEAARWLDRLGYHVARALHHLASADQAPPSPLPPAPESKGRRGDETYDARDD